jgi:hemolysin D
VSKDFAPDILTLQEQAPERIPRLLLQCVAALLVLMLAWAMLAKLDVIASAEGRLVPVSLTKVVQPAEAGIVDAILVKDGDHVKAGQVLLRLDSRLSGVELASLAADVQLKRLSLSRIAAELGGGAIQAVVDAPSDMAAKVNAQFMARKLAFQDAVAQEAAALNRAGGELEAAVQVQAKLQSILPMLKQAAESYRKLQKEGFVGEVAANEKQREFMEKERDLKSQESTVISLRAAVSQSQARLTSLRSTYRSQLETERVELLAGLNKSAADLAKTKIRGDLLEIRAPNDGVVKDLLVTTKGAVVGAGSVLMTIVPQNEPLQAEVALRNEDIGFVAPGQEVQVKIAAYPFQRYGLIAGKVLLVSADSGDGKSTGAAPQASTVPTYKALISLNSLTLRNVAQRQDMPLTSGMAVVAEIHQRQRTVMEYLVSPVQKITQEAGRER